jgi:membrane associated rhomboid family serine protease
MAECAECGKKTMSFTCHYCGKKFCSEHRLPENHDCGGLDSGKKEEYMSGKEENEESSSNSGTSRKSAPNQERWFRDRDVKSEVHRNSSSMPRILTDIKNTFKNSYTLSIILVTSLFFLAHETIPGLARLLMLYPALTEAAAASAGYSQTLLTHPWGLLSVILVHGGLFHILANMVTFYFFGTTLEKNIGSRKLLKFYVGTGILASIGYVLFSNLLHHIHGPTVGGFSTLSPAVGASGAVVAAVGTIAVLYPDAEVLLYFIIPMKIRTAVGVFGVIEIGNLVAKLAGTTLPVIGGFASSAHLTGLLAGIWFGKKIRDKHGRKTRLNLFS